MSDASIRTRESRASAQQLARLQKLCRDNGVTLKQLSELTGRGIAWLSLALRGEQWRPELTRSEVKALTEQVKRIIAERSDREQAA